MPITIHTLLIVVWSIVKVLLPSGAANLEDVGDKTTFGNVVRAQESNQPDYPQAISIPSLDVSFPILAVGNTEDGRMAVPEGHNIGWYEYGTKPGNTGSAVLAGHYKFDNGEEGVFYYLGEVKKGDRIELYLQNGERQVYRVEEVQIYLEKEFPSETVFKRRDNKWLTLITCHGDYDAESNDYLKRLVVYASLVEPKGNGTDTQ